MVKYLLFITMDLPVTHFPFSVSANIESTPSLGDIDNDGNYELAVATTMGLKVIDIKTESGEALSWKHIVEITRDLDP